jgi:hypothetical protein
MPLTATITIADDKLIDMLEDAGIRYWGLYASHKAIKEMVGGGRPCVVIEAEDQKKDALNVKHDLTVGKLQAAIGIIAEKWPHHMSSICGDYDAETGDVLVQVALFGDIVYG